MTDMTCKIANKVEIRIRVVPDGELEPQDYERAVLRGVNFNPFYTDMIYGIKFDTGFRDDIQVVRVFNKNMELESITTTIAGHQTACDMEETFGYPDIVVRHIDGKRIEFVGIPL